MITLFAALVPLLLSALAAIAQPAPDTVPTPASRRDPLSTALLGVDADFAVAALRSSGVHLFGNTIEQCSGQLTVEDGCGHRITIHRGQWVRIDNGCRGDLIWYCGNTREISRGVRGRNVHVFHSLNGRRIDISW